MPKRSSTLLAALATALAVPLAAGSARAPLLGVVAGQHTSKLARLDPETLRPVGTGIDVGSGGCASRLGGTACWGVPPWSWSPGRTRLVFARNSSDGYSVESLRFVDAGPARAAGDLRLSGQSVGAVAWLTPRRLLALQEVCCAGRQRLLAVDVPARRVTERHMLAGSVLQLDRAGTRLVLLLANGLGPASLDVVDAQGRIRSVPLGRVVAGTKRLAGSGLRFDSRTPGLAVDPSGRKAFVVDRLGVSVVDLRSLAVTYHALARAPAAAEKEARGWSRTARWIGNGTLAVTGSDATGVEGRERPAGVMLVDTRTWRARTVDPDATELTVAGNVLLATGRTGLAAYDLDGTRRFDLFGGELVWLAGVADGRAYVGGGSNPDGPLRIVDLARGAVVGERPQPLPSLVTATAGGWWN
jgi:hypothetical protein